MTSTLAPRPRASLRRITARSEPLARNLNPLALGKHLWGHRGLIWQFARREVEGRVPGLVPWLAVVFRAPLALLLIYTWVFGVVFRGRWPGARTAGLGEFALVLFSGLVVFNVFAECLSRAANLVVGAPSYVKKVAFPLEILPVSLLASAVFHGLLSLAILLMFCRLLLGGLPWTVVLIPLVALPAAFLCLGLTWLVASLGVFLRDLGHLVPLLLQVVFFSTPVIYPSESVPEPFRAVMRLNPLAWVVENLRRLLFSAAPPDWLELAVWSAATGAIMLLGYAWFMRTKKGPRAVRVGRPILPPERAGRRFPERRGSARSLARSHTGWCRTGPEASGDPNSK